MKDFCEIEGCENPGHKEVPVSENAHSDSKRTLCATCDEAYAIGAQHGNIHAEAMYRSASKLVEILVAIRQDQTSRSMKAEEDSLTEREKTAARHFYDAEISKECVRIDAALEDLEEGLKAFKPKEDPDLAACKHTCARCTSRVRSVNAAGLCHFCANNPPPP